MLTRVRQGTRVRRQSGWRTLAMRVRFLAILHRSILPSVFVAAGLLIAVGKAVAGDSTKPAFLDASDRITIALDRPIAVADGPRDFVLRCGGTVDRITQAEALDPGGVMPPVVLAGTFQPALGSAAWRTDDPHTRMTPAGNGVYTLRARLPRGHYEYKIVCGGSWSVNYGLGFKANGRNLSLDVPTDRPVLFVADFNRRTIVNSLDHPKLSVPRTQVPESGRILSLHLENPIGPDSISQPMSVEVVGQSASTYQVYARDVLSQPEYYYPGDDLGARWTPARTTFKVWSPVSTSIDLLLYDDATGGPSQVIPMHRGHEGVWWADVDGDLNGRFYQYRFTSYGAQRTAPDIYSQAASADLSRSMVIDLSSTDPAGWQSTPSPHTQSPVDIIAYELHLRDFTIDPSSGVPDALRGTYAGVISDGSRSFEHLRRLGVTHVQIMPFQSINHGDAGYNWGYETYLYDVPEPRYATAPAHPASVIREVKSMVAGLHRARIGVIMDVVYNHALPTSGDGSPFWCAVPYYYFRTGPSGEVLNESAVGNAIDDDHPMVRKYVVDSLLYWTREYHIDGFRFDLLGMFEPATVRMISTMLHRARPDIVLYGEPWTGGGPVRFGNGSQRGMGVAVFNDEFRTAVRGDRNGAWPGFALGGGVDPKIVQTAIAGSPDFTSAPTESINYASIHDDICLLDKIEKSLPNANQETQCRALRLAGAMVLLSQGVPVLEGGAEIGRTKHGSSNSFKEGDAVNRFDWERANQFKSVARYYAGLIALRRSHPAFRCSTAGDVHRSLAFLPTSTLPAQTVAFTLDGSVRHDAWRQILVVFHGRNAASRIRLPAGMWHAAVLGDNVDAKGAAVDGALSLAPMSAYVLYRE